VASTPSLSRISRASGPLGMNAVTLRPLSAGRLQDVVWETLWRMRPNPRWRARAWEAAPERAAGLTARTAAAGESPSSPSFPSDQSAPKHAPRPSGLRAPCEHRGPAGSDAHCKRHAG
jgi:hypothetical protein